MVGSINFRFKINLMCFYLIGGDQGLLNLYFSDWATKDISRHLPFIYNLCSTACYSYLPAFKQLSQVKNNIKL